MSPAEARSLFEHALQRHRAGDLAEAEALYRRFLAVHPHHADGLNLLGMVAHQRGAHSQAIALIERAIGLAVPAPARYHLNLGHALKGLGRAASALASYREAVRLKPDYAEGHFHIGDLLREAGAFDQAVAAYQAALALQPKNADAHNNLGISLQAMGQLEAAAEAYGRAIAVQPDYAPAHGNLANVHALLGRHDQAIQTYRQALRLQPDRVEPIYNLGTTLEDGGDRVNAVGCYLRVLTLQPDHIDAKLRLAHALQHLCDWGALARLEHDILQSVRQGAAALPPFALVALAASPDDQLACARTYAASLPTRAARPSPGGSRAGEGPIRLGYLSADFHAHATAYLIAELIERHDRGRFQVIGYDFGPIDDSDIRRRLIEGFDQLVDLRGLSHAQAASRIEADRIDILIDLKGYTQHARTQILALRPAPIQVNYLGYPATMGAEFIDYIIADAVCTPPGAEAFYQEQVVRLPHSYQPNDSRRLIDQKPLDRTQHGLPPAGFVFCSFNSSYKITPAVFDVWMRLLSAAPGSVLWLLESNGSVSANLRREAAARGVDPQRLVFAPRRPLAEHLARHRLADLFLDTLPCNAHTTASDALWAGLPLLTCAGETFAGRVAASLLTAVGLPQLITASLADYEVQALRLASDPALLAQLRQDLAQNRMRTPLFDTALYTRHLEAALLRMHALEAAGAPPQSFDLGPRS